MKLWGWLAKTDDESCALALASGLAGTHLYLRCDGWPTGPALSSYYTVDAQLESHGEFRLALADDTRTTTSMSDGSPDVRFTPKSGHRLSALEFPLNAKSRHQPNQCRRAS
jgi:hypothetical protein